MTSRTDSLPADISVMSAGSRVGGPKYNLTARSSRSNTITTNNFTVVALVEGRGPDRGTVGMACMDLRDPVLSLFEFYDSTSFTKLKIRLAIIDPVEILVPEAVADKQNHMKILVEMIRGIVPKGTPITGLQGRFFNDTKGVELVHQLGSPECCNVDTTVVKKYYCMSAAAALIKYIEYVQNILFSQKSLKIVYETVDDTCLIDVNSWTNLNLINVKYTPKDEKTLYSILNRCLTAAGSRLLRSCLLQPSSNVQVIAERLDVVQEFVSNPSLLERLRSMLTNTNDCQYLITLCICKNMNIEASKEESYRAIRTKITQILNLKKLILVVDSMQEALTCAKTPWLIKKLHKMKDPRLEKICQIIDSRIDENVLLRRNSGSLKVKDMSLLAVKEGIHVLLDLARKAYSELQSSISRLATEEGEKVPGAVLTYSFSRGYHLSLTSKDPLSVILPSHCIYVVRHRASVTYSTRDLVKYNDRLLQTETEILYKSNLVVEKIVEEIRVLLPPLHHVIEILTHLDLLTALATYSAVTKCVRPFFDNEMIVHNGRHPILDSMDKNKVVPNDAYIVPHSRFLIITGPNMAGKSTYMKQLCLLQILAQLGCFVPAEFASFAPMERIFSRVGHNDDITKNLSAFALEMSEIGIILPNANEKSLIVIDELARSTSTEEGMGICYAICERLIQSKAFVLFATHFLDLSLLELSFPVVQNFHFTFQTSHGPRGRDVLMPSHKLCKGTYKGPLYGFELAELTTFPPSLIDNARKLAEQLRSNVQIHRLANVNEDVAKNRRLRYIADRIRHVTDLATDDNKEHVMSYLMQLRERIQNNLLI